MLKSESKKSSIKFPISAIKMLDSTRYSCKMFLGMVAEHFVNFVIHSLMCPIWDEKNEAFTIGDVKPIMSHARNIDLSMLEDNNTHKGYHQTIIRKLRLLFLPVFLQLG